MKVASASAGVTPLPCVPPPAPGPGPPGGVRALVRAPVPPAAGLYAGIKFFLIDFIFKRCPRLRAKYDTPYIIWKSLPTDPQLKERSSAPASRRVGPGAGRAPQAARPLLCSWPAGRWGLRFYGALETSGSKQLAGGQFPCDQRLFPRPRTGIPGPPGSTWRLDGRPSACRPLRDLPTERLGNQVPQAGVRRPWGPGLDCQEPGGRGSSEQPLCRWGPGPAVPGSEAWAARPRWWAYRPGCVHVC